MAVALADKGTAYVIGFSIVWLTSHRNLMADAMQMGARFLGHLKLRLGCSQCVFAIRVVHPAYVIYISKSPHLVSGFSRFFKVFLSF